jgi:hypothetical protein
MISNNEPHPSSSFYFCLQQHPFNNYHPIGGSFISISLSLGHCPHYSSSLLSLVEILPQTLLRLWLEWCKKIPPCTIEFIRSQILLAIVATNSKSSFSLSISFSRILMKSSSLAEHFWIFLLQSVETSIDDEQLQLIWLTVSFANPHMRQSGS